MSLPEVLPALQQGTIDGVNSVLGVFVAFRYHDAAPNLLDTALWPINSLSLVSKVWFDKLPSDLQKAVLDAGRQTQMRTNKWEQEFTKTLDAKWREMGGQIHVLPPEDLAKMRDLLQSVGDDVSKDQPPVLDLLKKVRAVAAKH